MTQESNKDSIDKDMSLLGHFKELRSRITWMASFILIGMFGCFTIGGFKLMDFLLVPARRHIPDFRPQYIEPLENIVTFFQVCLLGGLAFAMPVIVYHILRFVSPALTKSERRWAIPISFGASLSFIGGMAFAYYLVLPLALNFLLTFGQEFARADWRIGNYINFVTRILFILGLVFETPLFVMGLAKMKVVTAKALLKKWRAMIVMSFLISAILTPTIDPVTQSLVAGPMIVLYFVGIGLAWIVRR
ncbi:MAG: sec-independent protein translocase protein TatC [Chloroflexi bacterium]|jgi:sec-independent protein translocase protein TatC|nr:MAG: sec-independent protein translocase protein TatC [Chloroflexota bacterium]